MYNQLVNRLNMLEIKRWIASDQFGPTCDEVKELEFQISLVNAELQEADVEPMVESDFVFTYWSKD